MQDETKTVEAAKAELLTRVAENLPSPLLEVELVSVRLHRGKLTKVTFRSKLKATDGTAEGADALRPVRFP